MLDGGVAVAADGGVLVDLGPVLALDADSLHFPPIDIAVEVAALGEGVLLLLDVLVVLHNIIVLLIEQ